jgi:diguanylate cyclase (GGDEF)-like protein/PAS domain S-box-containing protein
MQIIADLRQDGVEARNMILALRRVYQRQFAYSGLPINMDTIGFLPAHSMNRISKELMDMGSNGLIFRNVSDRPRHPNHQADPTELEAMNYFRSNRKQKDRLVYVNAGDSPYYHFSSPIWIEQNCLQCHGKRDEAIPSIAAAYSTAFDYKLGDLYGVFSIKLPATLVDNRVLNQRLEDIWGRLIAFALTFAFGGWLLHWIVTRRLTLLQSMANKLAGGDLTARLPANETDELNDLTAAFNNMAEQRQLAESLQLENKQQVQDLLNSTAEAIYGLDMQGNCTFANRACVNILGYQDSSDFIGRNMHSIIHHSRHNGCNFPVDECPIYKVLHTSKPSHNDNEVMWRAGGSSFAVEYWSHPIYRNGEMVGVVVTFLDITERKLQEEKILRQAHFDTLTNLPNRFLSIDRLTQLTREAQRTLEQMAVMFIDLDDFKKINDSLGHEVGDKLLIETAQRLNKRVRGGDTVGRLGGDEFIILLGHIAEADDASLVAENILDGLREPFNIDNRELMLTASIGIAIYPYDGETQSDLLRNADSAMYHSKERGRNTFSFFTEEMNYGVSRRLLLEEQMRGALERGEFYLCYQPKIDVDSNKIIGAEALLRWRNPALGEVLPTEFIPIAEQTGVIVPIGQFVLKQSLGWAAEWQRQQEAPFVVAVNLSPRQFRDPKLLSSIELIIEQAGIPAESLELEITEGVLMSGQGHIKDALNALSELGVSIAMDDFGTGYSSLSYLRDYPFNVLKIERNFINDIATNPADQKLVNAAIAMAHSLGMSVVAEGVESEEQLVLLAVQGCDQAQGYLFSKPIPPAGITNLLAQQRSDSTHKSQTI